MTPQKSILNFSRNASLQETRALILQKAGYSVLPAITDAQAISFMEGSFSFHLLLLCHSVPEPSRIYVISRMKYLYPNLPVLMLDNGCDLTAAEVDGLVPGLDSPHSMLKMIGCLLARKSDARSQ